MSLRDLVVTLRDHYGAPEKKKRDPWELIVLENVAYLVDDERRMATYRALEEAIGTTPEAILAADPKKLARAIRGGGMQPEHRAAKLIKAATIAQRVGLPKLRALMKTAPEEARRVLKRFPGIGDPGADKLLLFMGNAKTIAPDSNALRVLVRLGYGEEHRAYSTTYRVTTSTADRALGRDFLEAHVLLRKHGQELCKRTRPRCEQCPIAKKCAYQLRKS